MDTGEESDNDYETEEEEVNFPDNPNFVRVRRRKGREAPPTRQRCKISKEKLTPFKDLYEQQSDAVKDMLRVKFYKGNPVMDDPPPFAQFRQKLKSLKLEREEEMHRMVAQVKSKFPEGFENSATETNSASVNFIEVNKNDQRFVMVNYPGKILNKNRAIETLGGISTISQTFDTPLQKLTLKYRPEDLHCNGVRADVNPTVGLLLKIRHKKIRNTSTASEKTPHDTSKSPKKYSADSYRNSCSNLSPEEILLQDQMLLKEDDFIKKMTLRNYPNAKNNTDDFYLKIPKNYAPPNNKSTRISVVGIVPEFYEFGGVCDFQYLPMKKMESDFLSNREKLFPIFGDPGGSVEGLFVADQLLTSQAEVETSFQPPLMSRIDNQLELTEGFLDGDNVKIAPHLREKATKTVLGSTRARRHVYSIFYSFQSDKNLGIPKKPLKDALVDLSKRPVCARRLDEIKELFSEKPIWTKEALEYKMKLPKLLMKYLLPCVAYFATGGPWRASWIRFGFDPTSIKSTFIYQTVDFRVPNEYRNLSRLDSSETPDDIAFTFHPECLPPKAQMFYHLQDIRCPEVQELIYNVNKKISNDEITYDVRYGWLKEGTFEYLRHVLFGHLERLFPGARPIHVLSPKKLKPGEIEPEGKLSPRREKRFRKKKYMTTKSSQRIVGNESGKSVSKRRPPRGVKKEAAVKWEYQSILQDLTIRDSDRLAAEQHEFLEEDILSDDVYGTDDEF